MRDVCEHISKNEVSYCYSFMQNAFSMQIDYSFTKYYLSSHFTIHFNDSRAGGEQDIIILSKFNHKWN